VSRVLHSTPHITDESFQAITCTGTNRSKQTGGNTVTLNNASDYWANGLLSDYIGWTIGLSD